MRHFARLTFAVLSFFLLPLSAVADPCEAQLGKVDPGGAAAVRSDENRARDEVAKTEEHVNSNEADMQWKAKDAAAILDTAANHHKFETPFYAAGIGKAMEKGDIQAATILTICVQRRSGQASADSAAADANFALGEKTTQEDALAGGPKIYDENAFQGIVAP